MAKPSISEFLARSSMVPSATLLLLVLERVRAAIWIAYKFDFDWRSVIFLQRNTVALYYLSASILLGGLWFVRWFCECGDRKGHAAARASEAMVLIGMLLIGLLMVTGFAELT
jgi:hypothetical protein